MNIDHLREFIYLAETLSFSATAKRFYVSQSVLSKHVASMEDEIGAKLFVRDSHHVRLTKSGDAFLEEACTIVGSYERALARITAINQSYESVVRVGYLRNAARPFLAMFLKWMNREQPGVRVSLSCMEYGELYSALAMRKIDLALAIDLDVDMKARCNSQFIYEDCFDAIVSYDHPLASFQNEGIDAAQLEGQQLLLPDPSAYPGLSNFVEALLPPSGSSPTRQYYSDVDTMYLDVEMGKCVAFSSGHNIPVFGDKACFLRINDRPSCYSVNALWLKETSEEVVAPCLEALEYCRNRLASRSQGTCS